MEPVQHFVLLIQKSNSPYNTIPYPLLQWIFDLMLSMFNSRSQDTGFDLRVGLIKNSIGFLYQDILYTSWEFRKR